VVVDRQEGKKGRREEGLQLQFSFLESVPCLVVFGFFQSDVQARRGMDKVTLLWQNGMRQIVLDRNGFLQSNLHSDLHLKSNNS
jgi:hypothetical protein